MAVDAVGYIHTTHASKYFRRDDTERVPPAACVYRETPPDWSVQYDVTLSCFDGPVQMNSHTSVLMNYAPCRTGNGWKMTVKYVSRVL